MLHRGQDMAHAGITVDPVQEPVDLVIASSVRRCWDAARGTPAGGRGLPSRPQREVAPDPARLERAATLANCGLGAPLPGGCALGGFAFEITPGPRLRRSTLRRSTFRPADTVR
jgi:hypothetical protein